MYPLIPILRGRKGETMMNQPAIFTSTPMRGMEVFSFSEVIP